MWILFVLLVFAVAAIIAAFCLSRIIPFRRTREATLIKAAKMGDMDGMKTALKDEVDLNVQTPFSKLTALDIAVRKGHFDLTKTLLVRGATMQRGHLIDAVQRGYSEIVQLLLENGADPNTVAFSGVPVLYYATQKRDIRMVQLLLNKGADIDLPFTSPEHSFGEGHESGACPEIVGQLVKEIFDSRDPHACDICGGTGYGASRDYVAYFYEGSTSSGLTQNITTTKRKFMEERTIFVCQKCLDSRRSKFFYEGFVPHLDNIALNKMRQLYPCFKENDGSSFFGRDVESAEAWLRSCEASRRRHGGM